MTDTNSVGSDVRLAARYIDGYLRLGSDVLADQLSRRRRQSARQALKQLAAQAALENLDVS
jgi:hypothetical protein